MKKNISILLIAMLALSVCASGCAGKSDAGSTAAPETAAVETEAPETEAPEAQETEAPETEPEVVESDASETIAVETQAPGTVASDADSWKTIQEYGFNDGELNGKAYSFSTMSYNLISDTLVDNGDTYTIQAEFQKVVTVPADLQEGEEVTFTIDELLGDQITAVRKGNELVNVEEENDVYNYMTQEGSDTCYLTQFSDDAVVCPFYRGTLIIRKDATYAIPIMNEFSTLTESNLQEDPWFNGVAFDDAGQVIALAFFGD